MGWRTQTTIRHFTCRYCGDMTERLSAYSRQMDIAFCPNDGTELLIQVGGETMGKKNGKKLKVMHEVKTKHAQEKTIEQPAEPKTDPELERVFNTLGKLGGRATSPEIVKELGWEPEKGRQKVRTLMDKLHAAHRIHRTHEGKMYVFTLPDYQLPKAEPKAEAKAEPKVEVATA